MEGSSFHDQSSNLADPFPVFPDSFERSQIAGIENIPCGRAEPAFLEVVVSIACADRDKLQDARITIAVNHAASTAVADQFGLIELVNVAHRAFPKVTAVEIQIPIEVEVFVAA